MNGQEIKIIGSLTLAEVGSNPNTYPEEVVAASLKLVKDMEAQLREYKQNMQANMIRRMESDNATKLKFIDVQGNESILTLKKGSMKPNPAIKDPETFIRQNGFDPGQLGQYGFILLPWKEIKEIRKQGGNLQIICDELYKESAPSLVVE